MYYTAIRMSCLIRGLPENATRPLRAHSRVDNVSFDVFLVFVVLYRVPRTSLFPSCILLQFSPFSIICEHKLGKIAPEKKETTAKQHERNESGTRTRCDTKKKNQEKHRTRRKHLVIEVNRKTVAELSIREREWNGRVASSAGPRTNQIIRLAVQIKFCSTHNSSFLIAPR